MIFKPATLTHNQNPLPLKNLVFIFWHPKWSRLPFSDAKKLESSTLILEEGNLVWKCCDGENLKCLEVTLWAWVPLWWKRDCYMNLWQICQMWVKQFHSNSNSSPLRSDVNALHGKLIFCIQFVDNISHLGSLFPACNSMQRLFKYLEQ